MRWVDESFKRLIRMTMRNITGKTQIYLFPFKALVNAIYVNADAMVLHKPKLSW